MGHSHGTSWTEKRVEEEIQKFINGVGEGSFPTHKSLKEYGRYDLSNAITRSGGFIYWKNKMGYTTEPFESQIGWQGEKIAENLLLSLEYNLRKEPTNCIYDYTVNDCVRIDCKFSHIYHGKQGNFFSCNLESPYKDCDIFIVICSDGVYDVINYDIIMLQVINYGSICS
mgnify:CR=1 FL=1